MNWLDFIWGKISNNLKIIAKYIDFKNDQFILLKQKQQELISHPDHPINSLQQLLDKHLVFVNGQQDSGTRLLRGSLQN